MVPGRVWFGAPAACWCVGAFEGVVAELVTVEALGKRVEMEASLKSVVGGEGLTGVVAERSPVPWGR